MVLLKKCLWNHRLGPKQNNQFLLHPQTPGSWTQENKGRRNSTGFSSSNFLRFQVSYLQPSVKLKFTILDEVLIMTVLLSLEIVSTSKWGLRNETIKSSFQEVITVALRDIAGIVSPVWRNLLVCLESKEFSWKWTNSRISREISLISWQASFLECVYRPHRKKQWENLRKNRHVNSEMNFGEDAGWG